MESVFGQGVLVVWHVRRLVDGRQLEQVGVQRVPGRGREHICLVVRQLPVVLGVRGRGGPVVENRDVFGRGGSSREGRQPVQQVLGVHIVSVIHLLGLSL